MSILLLLHLAVGLIILAAGGRVPRVAVALAALAPAATLGWTATKVGDVLDGGTVIESVRWVSSLDLSFRLRLDGFSLLMLALVSGIGLLIVVYAGSYFSHPDARSTRLIGLLTLFGGSMVGLVLADHLLVLYGFWELTSITSFLLIGNQHEDANARAAALQALLITGLGGLAMLAGFVVLGRSAGTYELSALLHEPPSGTAVSVALGLILLGAFTKSAQYPFHSWLPGAMVAPTPVSAYLHSATMVKAGVYLVARLAPTFAVLSWWRPVVVTVGAVTTIAGGLRALRQTDLKLLLAMGTISQLGFMMLVLGWGSAEAMVAGSVLLLAHGAFKAAAFMIVGIIDHQAGTRDVRRLPRPGPGWRPVSVMAAVAAASMAGIPLLFGFISKEAAFEALLHGGTGGRLAVAAVVAGSALTAAYSARFLFGATGRLAIDPGHDRGDVAPPAAPSWAFVAPVAAVSAVSVLLGVWPGLADRPITAASRTLAGVPADLYEAVHLAVWHGVNVALLLSMFALVAAAAMISIGTRIDRVLDLGDRVPSSADGYRSSLRGLNTLANRVTAVSQPGSLPIYLGVILVTAAVVPGVALVTREWWPGWPDLVPGPLHVGIAALILGFGLAAAAVNRRFSAALFLGMTGYAMAALFLAQGAPDLALTQVAIETLTTVLFVLVLRRLPDRFEADDTHRALRRVVALGVGGIVFLLTLAISPPRQATTVSNTMIADAYEQADGRNVVNVILVDFRGYDTLGELTVLGAAAVGTVALARAGRRRGPGRMPAGDEHERLPPPVPLARLPIIDVSVRSVFALVIAGSMWLLFAGHNQPGGGFVGGIVAAAAVALRYAAGGIDEVRKISRGQPWLVLGAGLLLAAVTAAVPLAFGGAVLESHAWTFSAPLVGDVKLTSPLFFDVGVYVAVMGLGLMVFESFGDDAPAPTRVAP